MARTSKRDQELVREVIKFVDDNETATQDERELMIDDLNFVYDEEGQWDEHTLKKRGGRPCYTFNHCIGAVNQVIGEQRMFKPQIKLRGVDNKSDKELAEVMGGLIRNIEALSGAEAIYDGAFKMQVAGGYGAWRIVSEYRSATAFEQEIFIKPIHNPMTVFFDHVSTDPFKTDQNRCVIAERVSEDFYKANYGKMTPTEIKVARDSKGWANDEGVRIAEYFKRVPVTKEIVLMSDGRVLPYDDAMKSNEQAISELGETGGVTIVKKRTVKTYEVHWWKVDGKYVLEGPIVYQWERIPVVKLPGRYINIEGEEKTQSLIRHAHDPQKVYNYNRTTMSEAVGNTPKVPYLVTPAMISGYENQWAKSAASNMPYLLYNPDPEAPAGAAAPQRVPMADVPQAFTTMAAQDADDIKRATGFFDSALGKQGNEISGVAIGARQRQADVGSYEFYDNLSKAIQITGEMLVNMIPTVYDTTRTVRILGLDGSEDFKEINAYDEAQNAKLDLAQARYDVTVDIGPTFASQRQEAFTNLIEAAGVMPIIADLASDLVLKNLDVPGGDEIVERVRKQFIQNGIVEPTEEELEAAGPPEQPAPDPVQDALVMSEKAKAGLNEAKTAKTEAETMKIIQQMPVEQRQLISDLISSTLQQFKE